jgi:CubicO group peptidase (beta-lactamase class C family)
VLFRSSVSKTFTATAVMKLVEQGRLQLDGTAWDLIKDFIGAKPLDPRVKQVTLRQLLTHSWGLDRAVTTEPNGRWITVNGQLLHLSRDLLRNYLLTKRLDFAPGARYAYNGLGFSWLQLITELQTGQPLGEQLTAMLGPEALSTGRVRIGSTNSRLVTPAEPVFHDPPGAAQVAPMPGLYAAPAPATVPVPYGSFTLESYGGGGGLMASALTVARFVQRLQGIRQPALLQPATYATMRTEQPVADGTRYIGLGVQVVPTYGTDHWISFNGSIPGTRTGWLSTPRTAGGALRIDSRPDRGTTVSITLLTMAAPAPAATGVSA